MIAPEFLKFPFSQILIEKFNSVSMKLITEPGNEINCLDFSMSGEKFVTGGKDLDIRMYDAETNQVKYNFLAEFQKLLKRFHDS